MPKTILVVDDEADTVRLLTLRLIKSGYEVIPCLSGEEALEMVQVKSPDLAILDLHLPYMSGYEILDHFRKSNSLASMPVIFSTADASVALKKQTREHSANAYVVKPYDAKDLLKKIETLLAA